MPSSIEGIRSLRKVTGVPKPLGTAGRARRWSYLPQTTLWLNATVAGIRIWDFLQVTLPVLHGATHDEAAGERKGLAEPSADGNELEEARAALGAGWYEKGDACGAGCPFPELAGAGAVMATTEQLPGLRWGYRSPHELVSSSSSPLTPQKMSDTLPPSRPPHGQNPRCNTRGDENNR